MSRVFVAGHGGMVGSAICRHLSSCSDIELITRTRDELNLLDQAQVENFFSAEKIDHVYLAAAKVGGIAANSAYPADFIYQNLVIQTNVIGAAHKYHIDKLLFLGSSCIYPRLAEQPMNEAALLTGSLEPTNEPYAIAKIAGIKLCEAFRRQYQCDFRSVMPTNLYGPVDNFHPQNSHVIPAMMRRFHEAKLAESKQVVVWGSGRPMREFLHVDDMAAACVHTLALPRSEYEEAAVGVSHLNVGSGVDCTISELAELMAKVVGFKGTVDFDSSKPDGAPRKLLDVSSLNSTGWSAEIGLEDGLQQTYQWFISNESDLRSS